jgi:hypothetical protein
MHEFYRLLHSDEEKFIGEAVNVSKSGFKIVNTNSYCVAELNDGLEMLAELDQSSQNQNLIS